MTRSMARAGTPAHRASIASAPTSTVTVAGTTCGYNGDGSTATAVTTASSSAAR